ncbi:MAG: cytochrome c4 [Cellvibrionaceae bacterium]|nr:cytochrome c4 [Cellvibrionaceae bacterium]MCV6627397.1 cytochrome c4 [Cellvibrionaceae bacterium]
MKNFAKYALVSIAALATAPAAIAAGDAAAGEGKTLVCAACHGQDGNSAVATFPKLANLGEKYLLKQMQDIKSGARNVPEMTGMLVAMNDQDLADIAAFYSAKAMQLAGAKKIDIQLQSGLNSEDPIALGAKVYRAGNNAAGTPACSGCHSPRGQGNAPAGYPRLSGQHADYIEKQLKAFRNGDRTNDGDTKIMRGVAQYMTDAEIKAVANYIAGLN